jgi:hypothetical protein
MQCGREGESPVIDIQLPLVSSLISDTLQKMREREQEDAPAVNHLDVLSLIDILVD